MKLSAELKSVFETETCPWRHVQGGRVNFQELHWTIMRVWCWAELSVGTTRRPLEEWEVMAVARQDLAGTKTRSCSMHRNNERGRMLPCWQFWHFDHNCTKFHHQQMSRDQHCGLLSAPEAASLLKMVVKLCLSHNSSVGDYIWLVAFNILV